MNKRSTRNAGSLTITTQIHQVRRRIFAKNRVVLFEMIEVWFPVLVIVFGVDDECDAYLSKWGIFGKFG